MKQRILFLVLAVCVGLSLLTACATTAASTPTALAPQASATTQSATATVPPATKATSATPQPSAATNSEATVAFTDDAGRKVNVPKNITRLVPSGPLAQMVIFGVAPEKIVGLSSAWAAETKPYIPTDYYNLPVLGQLYGTNASTLNLEEIAKTNPQVIIDVGEAKSTIVEDMDKIQKQLNIPTIHIDAAVNTMSTTYRKLGQLLGKDKEAEVLAQYLDKSLATTQDIVKKVGDTNRTKVLYCLGDKGINVIAKGSYHAGVLDMTTNNVAVVDNPSSKGTGNEVDMEQIVLWNPDVIIFAPQSVYSKVGSDATWQRLTAIKNKKYYEAPLGPYNWMGFPPSVNQYLGMTWITQLLYPTVANRDVYTESATYFDLFYHTKLTDTQYKSLVANSLASR